MQLTGSRSHMARVVALGFLLRLFSPPKACAENQVATKFENYHEQHGRIEVDTFGFFVESSLRSSLIAKGEFIYDAISGATPTGGPPLPGSDQVPLARRFLRLHNDTGRRLTVQLVYQTLDSQRKWHWLPGKPPSSRVVQLDLPAGATLQAKHGGEPILASRARIWATGGDSRWYEWKDRDLLLVPEKDDNGGYRYYARAHDTFTFRFRKK